MKIKKAIIAALTAVGIATAMPFSLSAFAEDTATKEDIFDAIWEEWWFGTPETGTEFPEASYEKHLIDEWLDENYEDVKNDISRAAHLYREYYKDLVDEWTFKDDGDGNYTIADLDGNTLYHFTYKGGKWNMADENGNVVDSFMPFNTITYEAEKEAEKQEESSESEESSEEDSESTTTQQKNQNRSDKTGNSVHRVVGETGTRPFTTPVETTTATEELPELTTTKKSNSFSNYLIMGIAVLVLTGGVVAIYKAKNKKGDKNHDSKK